MKKIIALVLALIMVFTLCACGKKTETIKVLIPYGVGGTADVVTRKFAEVANKIQTKYNFVCEQMTGGDGFAATTYYTGEKPTEKDILVVGYGVNYRHDLGKAYGTEEVDFDRSLITPLATIDDRTWILYTTPDQSLASILEKAKTEGIKMSGGNPLSDPHLALGSLIASEGGTVQVVPYDGGAEQKKGLTDGEVDVFVGSTQAGQSEVEAGTIIPILAFSDKTFDGFVTPSGAISVPGCAGAAKAPELDASKDYSGSILPAGGVLALHTGCDQAYYNDILDLCKKVCDTPEFYEWIASVLLNRNDLFGADAVAFLEGGCAKALAAYEMLQ